MKHRKLRIAWYLFALLLIALALFPAPASAWNSLGHKTVAEIAWRQLDPKTRQSIVELLRRHPRFDKDFASKMDDKALTGDKSIEDEWIFQLAATWPDLIRKQKELDRPTWHYISIPLFLDPSDKNALEAKFAAGQSADYPTKTPPDKYNVLQALSYSCDTLKGKAGPGTKAIACCWVMHLVGDLHQPLHCNELVSSAYCR